MRDLLAELQRIREAAGQSLTEVAAKTGIDKSVLSRLENGLQPNPTVATLARYAAALGKRIAFTVVDED